MLALHLLMVLTASAEPQIFIYNPILYWAQGSPSEEHLQFKYGMSNSKLVSPSPSFHQPNLYHMYYSYQLRIKQCISS